MFEALDRFRDLFGARPLFVAVAVLALLHVTGRPSDRAGRYGRHQWGGVTTFLALAGVASLALYAAILIWYTLDRHFFDYAEPSVVAISWLFRLGQPVYHVPASAERYSHIYGPLTFMLHGWILGAFGPGILVSKLLSAAAAAAGLVLTFMAARRHVSAPRAISLAGVAALLLLGFKNFSYWTRPEPFQTLAVAVSLAIAVAGRGMGAALAVGLASGVLWNLKITGPLYSLPILVMLERRSGWRACATAVAVGMITAALPFVLFENVSFANYLYWVRLSANTGLLLSTLKQNLEWAMYFGLPLLLAYFSGPPRSIEPMWVRSVAALGAGMVVLAIAAAKPGAGPYHFMPFLPVIVYLVAWGTKDVTSNTLAEPMVPRAAIAFIVAAITVAVAQQSIFIATMMERHTRDEAADIERFARAHQGVVEMGYGTTEALSLARPILVFRTGTYLIDQPAVREHQLEGLEMPRATLDALAGCRAKYWLIPKGEAPFAGRNAYAAVFQRPIFPDGFRDAFLASHTRSGRTEYYDVWECTASR